MLTNRHLCWVFKLPWKTHKSDKCLTKKNSELDKILKNLIPTWVSPRLKQFFLSKQISSMRLPLKFWTNRAQTNNKCKVSLWLRKQRSLIISILSMVLSIQTSWLVLRSTIWRMTQTLSNCKKPKLWKSRQFHKSYRQIISYLPKRQKSSERKLHLGTQWLIQTNQISSFSLKTLLNFNLP